MLEYADKENLDGLIFAADIEKDFDSIDHNFLLATLTKYGFGSNFIQWIKTLFSNCESCVMNNGLSTGYGETLPPSSSNFGPKTIEVCITIDFTP